MEPFASNVLPIRIQDELRSSYLDYSMSVIIGRALPDVRDGLKPVHRRILYAMHREGLASNKKYSKCAGVIGEVLKKYHPHGDSAVYDALVRMAQPWNLRYLLVDGQGNFGSVDGDPPAAYRYTESRMQRFAEELLVDIDKETVGFVANFDDTTVEPEVLPARVPNLLVNGAEGIAVGMATKIPPHNAGEVIDAAVALIDDPEIDLVGLMEHVQGPDFPTAAFIYGRKGIWDAYDTGRGRIVVRGRAEVEELGKTTAIVIDEIPYQVNKARLIEQVADLVKDRRLEGIRALRDESDRSGMRIVIELKKDAFPEVVLNHLYKHTQLQVTYGVIMLAIVDQRPRVLSLKEMLSHFVRHRRDVILRRSRYELKKARERAHILEGFLRALDLLDEVIATIRASADASTARAALVERFAFTEVQAQAILEMRLQRLTGMERQKIVDEYDELMVRIAALESILGSEIRLMDVVKEELLEVRAQYADPRRTVILEAEGEVDVLDLVPEEDQVVTMSRLGYIKRCSPDEWRTQKRGGVGRKGMGTRDEDFVTSLFIANTHSLLLVFTLDGRVFPLHVYTVPQTGRAARGRPIVNLVELPDGTGVAAVVPVLDFDRKSGREEDESEEAVDLDLVFVSRKGLVKRTPLSGFRNLRRGGLIAAGVAEGDELLVVRPADRDDTHLMLLTQGGKSIRFDLSEVPVFGRSARGNRGMVLSRDDVVVDALLVPAGPFSDEDTFGEEDLTFSDDETQLQEETEIWDTTLLTVTELGYGKRTPFEEYRVQGRYGKGIIAHRVNDDTGGVVGGLEVAPDDQIMLVTDTGRVIRFVASEVRLVKTRGSRGVRLMRLDAGERIVDIARLEDSEDDTDADSLTMGGEE